MNRTAVIAAAAVGLVLAAGAGANAGSTHHRTHHRAALTDSVNAMDLEELYNVGEGQQQGNVQDLCACTGYVLSRWTNAAGVEFKTVQYPALQSDGTTSQYGDIIRYRVTTNGRNLTDSYVTLVRDGVGEPMPFLASGSWHG